MGSVLSSESRIAALVPHFNCEPYLASCLESLLEQSRPLEAIIVLDDGSKRAPIEIVARYPEVTLLRARINVGPYGLVQQAITDSAYDGYLFQDADDRSTPFRLERLLALAEETGAELVGCQAIHADAEGNEQPRAPLPFDVNATLRDEPGRHAFLHGSSLVSRRLVASLGGFASGLRFGADSEFLWRAHYAGIIRNSDYVGYRRLLRPDSLTHAPETGFGSPAREALKAGLLAHVAENVRLVAAGLEPDLYPYLVGAQADLEHLCGPAVLTPSEPALESRPAGLPDLAFG